MTVSDRMAVAVAMMLWRMLVVVYEAFRKMLGGARETGGKPRGGAAEGEKANAPAPEAAAGGGGAEWWRRDPSATAPAPAPLPPPAARGREAPKAAAADIERPGFLQAGRNHAQGSTHDIKVRGPNYLKDRVKVQATTPVLRMVGAQLLEVHEHVPHRSLGDGALLEACKTVCADGEQGATVFVVHFQNPRFAGGGVPKSERPHHALHLFFAAPVSPADVEGGVGECLRRFFDSAVDDETAADRLKVLPKLDAGPRMLRAAVATGGSRPFLVARHVKTRLRRLVGDGTHTTGHVPPGVHVALVDVDVSSSTLGSWIYGVGSGFLSGDSDGGVVARMAWILEARAEAELPEMVLASASVSGLCPAVATKV